MFLGRRGCLAVSPWEGSAKRPSSRRFSCDSPVVELLILLVCEMTQTVPLGAALGVEGNLQSR